jgi:hypothetical protein
VSYIEDGPNGFPVLRLADPVPPAAKKDPPKPKAEPEAAAPATSLELELARRRDAVREAAREFELLSEQDVRERLRGATSRPLSEAEVAQFAVDVATQVLDDLVDLMDQMLKGAKRKRRRVRIQAPRGYVRKALNDRTDQELASLVNRLQARGWTTAQLKDHLSRHLMDDRVDRILPRIV